MSAFPAWSEPDQGRRCCRLTFGVLACTAGLHWVTVCSSSSNTQSEAARRRGPPPEVPPLPRGARSPPRGVRHGVRSSRPHRLAPLLPLLQPVHPKTAPTRLRSRAGNGTAAPLLKTNQRPEPRSAYGTWCHHHEVT